MKRGISQKNIIFRIENWKLIWRRQFFLEVGIIFQKMVAEVELFALLKNLNFSFEDWKLIYHCQFCLDAGIIFFKKVSEMESFCLAEFVDYLEKKGTISLFL